MAGDWIKIKSDLHESMELVRITRKLEISEIEGVFLLYKTASWFVKYGHYGKLAADTKTLDRYLSIPGFSQCLTEAGWLKVENGRLILSGFCEVSRIRKSLGAKLRRQILAEGKCRSCGETENLVIDHIVPIVRGGTCEAENLQPLCRSCNIKKGRKTQEEWEIECG